MSVIDEIVAWVRQRADAEAVPPPAAPEVLAELAARGAPADVLAIYRAVGGNIMGLLSHGPRPWLRTADGAQADPRGGWVLAEDLGGWLVVVDGVVVRRPRLGSPAPRGHAAEVRVADSVEAMLAGRLALIRSGALVWDADLEALVGVHDEIADRTLLSGVVALSTGGRTDAFGKWTRAVVDGLCAARGDAYQVEVTGVGVIQVTDADEAARVDFVAAPWLAWRLMPDGPEPARTEVVAIPGVQLSEGEGQALGIAVSDTLGAALAEGNRVWWPGLGVFSRFRVPPVGGRPERLFPDFSLFSVAERPFLRAVADRRASLGPRTGRDGSGG